MALTSSASSTAGCLKIGVTLGFKANRSGFHTPHVAASCVLLVGTRLAALVSLQQITLFGRSATARVAGINGRAAREDLGTAPKVKVLSGEHRRERVISPDEEAPLSRSRAGATSLDCFGAGRHRNAPGEVLPVAMEICHLAERTQWRATRHPREDSVGPSRDSNDASRSSRS